MKKKAIKEKKYRNTKTNINFRRKIGLIYKKLIFILKIALVMLICLFAFTKAFSSFKLYLIKNIYVITANIGFKLENVIIEGQNNVPESNIINILNADKNTPIFAINLNNIRNDLKKNKWIKDAYIGRKLPNTLDIKLFEREPVAIWQINQQLFLIDEDGYEITSNIEPFPHLLHVVGAGANIYASKLVDELKKYPALMIKSISAVRWGNRRWDLNLEKGITVKLPSGEFNKALKYIDDLNKENKLFNQNYKILDLRDANKYYIEKW